MGTTSPGSCSQLHRDLAVWAGTENADCGPDISGLIELTPLGNDLLLARRRVIGYDGMWQLTPEGAIATNVPKKGTQVDGGASAAFTLMPGPAPRVFVSNPRLTGWSVYRPDVSDPGVSDLGTALRFRVPGTWPVRPVSPPGAPGYWKGLDGTPWGHQFLGLDQDHLLDWDPADGSSRVWELTTGLEGLDIVLRADLAAGPPRPELRRGHRLAYLDAGRLLEWIPRWCGPGEPGRPGSASQDCGADYSVWADALDGSRGTDPLGAPNPVARGAWTDVGAGQDILGDGKHLLVWTRATGALRAYRLDPASTDPLAADLLSATSPENDLLKSADWDPPVAASGLKHLVVMLQNGRSFDSYFGQYCRGSDSVCDDRGELCCEPMPSTTSGADACTPLDPDGTMAGRRPVDTPACMRAKMNDGAMDGFVAAPMCGDSQDFVCAGVGDAAGAVGIYHRLAAQGALGDSFFQSYAFLDGEQPAILPSPSIQNLLYLITTRFTADPGALSEAALITKELVRQDVPWAIYAGRSNLAAIIAGNAVTVPVFYDPTWIPFRSLEAGELESDLANGALPSVAVVLPDDSDPARSEAPGHPFGDGIRYVADLVENKIETSRYGNETLVLITYLTAGGFYDHVRPPPPPPVEVDAFGSILAQAVPVPYGPRTPLLALGPFARSGAVSHAQMELSSITLFMEWNWLHGSTLQNLKNGGDFRLYRDTMVNNLGTLLRPDLRVPRGHE